MFDSRDRKSHWRRTASLAMLVLLFVGVVTFVLLTRIGPLNGFIVLGFPIGFYAAAQGLVVGVAITAFWFTARQERLDRKFGVEDD